MPGPHGGGSMEAARQKPGGMEEAAWGGVRRRGGMAMAWGDEVEAA